MVEKSRVNYALCHNLDSSCRLIDRMNPTALAKAVKNETGGFWVEDGPARTCDTVHAGRWSPLCCRRKSPPLWSRRIFR